MVCGAGAGKISQTHAGVARGGFKFCGCEAGADTKFQPAQDSSLQTSSKIKVKEMITTSVRDQSMRIV